MKKTIGGDRLGSGKKLKVDLHNWGRSTHNQSRIWRSTAGCGYGIPCFVEIGTNGTTFDIDINALGHTIPTISPLFGSFKMQIDMFACPFRLYQGLLHNNAQRIGLNMSQVLLPKLTLTEKNQKVNTSSLLNYIGIKGTNNENEEDSNTFSALEILAYYDIFKNYYCNKQEDYAKCIATEKIRAVINITNGKLYTPKSINLNRQATGLSTSENILTRASASENSRREFNGGYRGVIEENTEEFEFYAWTDNVHDNQWGIIGNEYITINKGQIFQFTIDKNKFHNGTEDYDPDGIYTPNSFIEKIQIQDINGNTYNIIFEKNKGKIFDTENETYIGNATINNNTIEFKITTETPLKIQAIFLEPYEYHFAIKDFPLENLDEARRIILAKTTLDERVTINNDLNFAPYSYNILSIDNEYKNLDKQGLMLKTYQNDIFNTWLSTEFVDLINNISSVAVDENGSFNIDSFILAKKVYNMLNRIAISGGTYEDWQEANWGEDAIQRAESPIYIGGMSTDIEFEEIVSTAETENQPLATLGGKGILNNRKGGNIVYKCQEPCIIMGILSITPRVDYHQGNKWYTTNLDNMDDLHKPGLDGVGFQNLIANQVHWKASRNQALAKQPAWIEYQTAVNEVFGQFAKDEDEGEDNNLSQMVLRRNYEIDDNGNITDFTTYIDPAKYNYAFAVNDLKSENFWIQLGFNVKSRRKMATSEIPNL